MIYLQKFLPFLFLPITLIIALLIGAIVTKKRYLIVLALSLLILCSLPITSKNLVRFIEEGALKLQPIDVANADAVVVLSGFIGRVNSAKGPVLEWGNAARYFAGIELMKANKAPFLIFTNEKLPWMPDTIAVGDFLSTSAQEMGIEKSQILLSSDVQNTADEAKAIQVLAQKHGLRKIILVTSAFHMARAKLLLTQTGLEVIAYPVSFGAGADATNLLDFIPNADALRQTEGVLKELMGRAYYRLITLL